MYTITFYDLKGQTFRAPGNAGNDWSVMSVRQDKSLVRRLKDGLEHWIDTGMLLAIINANPNSN